MTPDYRFLMPKNPTADHALDRQWYVRVEGETYGPYDDATMWGFVQESRVTVHSEVSVRPDRGFRPARDWLEIAHWFHPPVTQPVAQPVTQSRSPEPRYEPVREPAFEPTQNNAGASQPQEYVPAASQSTNLLLVVANIRSGRLSLFTQTMTTLGQMRPLTASTWLVESAIDPENAKSVLSPALASTDSLLIVDASDAVFASCNLGIEGDDGFTPTHSAPTDRLFGG